MLNTNVTHGVFRNPLPLAVLFKNLKLDKMKDQGQRPDLIRELRKVHKLLKRARVECQFLSPQGKKAEVREKVLWGLASSRDGPAENRPQFSAGDFGGPETVSFYLNEPSPGQQRVSGLEYNQYCTVDKYYQTSKHHPYCDSLFPLITTP